MDDRLHFAGFDIAFRGRSIDVVVLARGHDEAPPTVDAIVAALRRTPLDRAPRDLIGRALEAAVDPTADVRIPVGQLLVTADDPAVPCAIVLSGDALAAYAVPAGEIRRPETDIPDRAARADGGDRAEGGGWAAERRASSPSDTIPQQPPGAATGPSEAATMPPRRIVPAGALRQLLARARVTTGILDEVVDAFGDGEPLTRITCVAIGEPPVPGVDGSIAYHFDRNPRLAPKPREDGSVDFHAMLVERFVEADAVLVTRHAPVAGRAGVNVLGNPMPVPSLRDAALEPLAGEHVLVRGNELVATLGGRPVPSATGRIDIVPVYEVPGDLDYGVGNIEFPGDVIVRGDVKPGFTIAAGGSVVVQGLVEGASIAAGQDLTVMGVVGEHWSVFRVGGTLTAQYLHTTEARVGADVHVAREIVNCRIDAERVTMTSTGRLVGGSLTAHTEVDAGVIGATNGTLTEVTVRSREPSAVIRAHRAVHPGAVLRVGGARREVADEAANASFWDVAGSLVMLRAAAESHEVAEATATQTEQPGAA